MPCAQTYIFHKHVTSKGNAGNAVALTGSMRIKSNNLLGSDLLLGLHTNRGAMVGVVGSDNQSIAVRLSHRLLFVSQECLLHLLASGVEMVLFVALKGAQQ